MVRRRHNNGDGPIELRVPIIDIEVDTYTLVQWFVDVGDSVEIDMDIAELDDGKERIMLPSPLDGVITDINFSMGDTVVVGDILAVITESDVLDSMHIHEGGPG